MSFKLSILISVFLGGLPLVSEAKCFLEPVVVNEHFTVRPQENGTFLYQTDSKKEKLVKKLNNKTCNTDFTQVRAVSYKSGANYIFYIVLDESYHNFDVWLLKDSVVKPVFHSKGEYESPTFVNIDEKLFILKFKKPQFVAFLNESLQFLSQDKYRDCKPEKGFYEEIANEAGQWLLPHWFISGSKNEVGETMAARLELFRKGIGVYKIQDDGKLVLAKEEAQPFIEWRNNLYKKYRTRYNTPNCASLLKILTSPP